VVELEVLRANEQTASTEADRPDHSDAGDGDAIRCRVKSLDGTSLLVDAVQTDDEGRLRLATKLLKTLKTEMVPRRWHRRPVRLGPDALRPAMSPDGNAIQGRVFDVPMRL